ncbi:unnamed protein product [Cercospora beticola]|nr:unnamed protein product [Cercospora beticola]
MADYSNGNNGDLSGSDAKERGLNGSGPDTSHDFSADAIERIRTASTINMTPELFERLYLQPPTKVKGDLRKTFGNPTPLALTGFVIGLTPLSCQLMGWRGSGGLGSGTIGVYYFIGGPCMWIGGLLEWFLGNTFSFVVFFFYGGIMFGWGATLHPFYNGAGAYGVDGTYRAGLAADGFWASLAFWPVAAGMISFVFMIGASRINAVFVMVFLSIGLGFLLLAAAFWEQALGDADMYDTLLQGGGGCWFVCSLCGWYLLFQQILDSVGFTLQLPVGDFSKFWARREGRVELVEPGAVA